MKLTDKCIYCGCKRNLTKEHVSGDWLKPYIKASHPKFTHRTSFIDGCQTSQFPVESMAVHKVRNGSPHQLKLRILCNKCNESMGKIQENAKPILIKLLKGNWPEWNKSSIEIIATWVTMVTISIEFADRKTQTVSDEERAEFRNSLLPGKNFLVYIGLCNTGYSAASFWHRAGCFLNDDSDNISKKANTQTTTLYFGKTFFHVFSSSKIYLEPEEYAIELGMRQIWPSPIISPMRPLVFDDNGVNRSAAIFWKQFGISTERDFGMRIVG